MMAFEKAMLPFRRLPLQPISSNLRIGNIPGQTDLANPLPFTPILKLLWLHRLPHPAADTTHEGTPSNSTGGSAAESIAPTDPEVISSLWAAVYEQKHCLDAAAMEFTSTASTKPILEGGMAIDRDIYPTDPAAFFGSNGPFMPPPARPELTNILSLAGSSEFRTLAELTDVVQAFLVPRTRLDSLELGPDPRLTSAATTSSAIRWHSQRFLCAPIPVSHYGACWLTRSASKKNGNTVAAMAAVSFWLAFPADATTFRALLGNLTPLLGSLTPPLGGALCPYLSVEYHNVTGDGAKDELEAEAALRRLSAAGGDALYNRVLLRVRALSKVLEAAAILDGMAGGEDMKHFGITISWDTFCLWEITPVLVADLEMGTTTERGLTSATTDRMTTSANLTRETGGRARAGAAARARAGARAGATTSSWAMRADPAAPPSTSISPGSGPDYGRAWDYGRMRRLLCHPTRGKGSLEVLAGWLDHIHAWGISTYAQGVEQDVRRAYPDASW